MSLAAPDRRRWWALGLLSIAQFLVIMDTSIIGIALPDIQQALGFSDASLQWVFNAYVIAFGGLLLLGGRLADHFGARRVFSAGFIILTVTSLLAGLAWSDAVLVAARAGQGLGAALIAPAAMALVLRLFTEPADLGKAMGIWAPPHLPAAQRVSSWEASSPNGSTGDGRSSSTCRSGFLFSPPCPRFSRASKDEVASSTSPAPRLSPPRSRRRCTRS